MLESDKNCKADITEIIKCVNSVLHVLATNEFNNLRNFMSQVNKSLKAILLIENTCVNLLYFMCYFSLRVLKRISLSNNKVYYISQIANFIVCVFHIFIKHVLYISS